MKNIRNLSLATLMLAIASVNDVMGMMGSFKQLYIVNESPLEHLSISLSYQDFSSGNATSHLYTKQPFAMYSGNANTTAPKTSVSQQQPVYQNLSTVLANVNNNNSPDSDPHIYENVNALAASPHEYFNASLSSSLLPYHIEIYNSVGRKIVDYNIKTEEEYKDLFDNHQGVLKVVPKKIDQGQNQKLGLVDGNPTNVVLTADPKSLARPLYIVNSSGQNLKLTVTNPKRRILVINQEEFDAAMQDAQPKSHPSLERSFSSLSLGNSYQNVTPVILQKKVMINDAVLPYEITVYDHRGYQMPLYNQEGAMINHHLIDTDEFIRIFTGKAIGVLKIAPITSFNLEKVNPEEANAIKSLHDKIINLNRAASHRTLKR